MKKTIKIIVTVIILAALGWVIYFAVSPNPPPWTGFGERTKDPLIEPAKTLFDWLKLMIIPLALALIGWTYKEAEKSKVKKSQEEKFRAETLESFLKHMTGLMQNNALTNNPSVQTKALVKTRINLALGSLDEARKGQVLQFLYESDLIDTPPIIRLIGANFDKALLDKIVLGNAEIRSAFFRNASIKNANLNEITLNSCNLEKANLSRSQVNQADFSYTNLTKCKLKNMTFQL